MKNYGKGCKICVLNYKFAAKSLQFSTIYGCKNLPHIMAITCLGLGKLVNFYNFCKCLNFLNDTLKIPLLKTILRLFSS